MRNTKVRKVKDGRTAGILAGSITEQRGAHFDLNYITFL